MDLSNNLTSMGPGICLKNSGSEGLFLDLSHNNCPMVNNPTSRYRLLETGVMTISGKSNFRRIKKLTGRQGTRGTILSEIDLPYTSLSGMLPLMDMIEVITRGEDTVSDETFIAKFYRYVSMKFQSK